MKLLVVVDMQNDFVTGSLGSAEAESIVPKVVERVRAAVEEGETVVFTRDTHDDNYMDTQEGRKLPVPHCCRDTEGWQIIPALEGYTEGRLIFDKPTFGSTKLANWAAEGGYDRMELVGLCTDICVISNAVLLKAARPEAEVVVNAACCAGVSPEGHRTALEAMKPCQITII